MNKSLKKSAVLLPLVVLAAMLLPIAATFAQPFDCTVEDNPECPWEYKQRWVFYDPCWLLVTYKVRQCDGVRCRLEIEHLALDEQCVCHPNLTTPELLEETVRDLLGRGMAFVPDGCQEGEFDVYYPACMRQETVTIGTGGNQYQTVRYQGCADEPCCYSVYDVKEDQDGNRVVTLLSKTVHPAPVDCEDEYYPPCSDTCN